tara:strand:- start:265 stop:723 length:459 start_codon:yes stop_codon:yes gene_type:complete
MTDNALKLDYQLCHRFYTVANAFTRAYRPLLRELDITYPQYVVLMALWEKDQITIHQLLEKTHIDGGAMSLILKKLTQKSFVQVIHDQHDKRVKRVVLSDYGKKAKHIAQKIPQQMRCNLKNVSDEEGMELIRLIDKVSDDLHTTLCEADTQ